MPIELTERPIRELRIRPAPPADALVNGRVAPFPALAAAQILSKTLIFVTFCLISLGSLVRNEGAGLSCPDWPLCFGKVVPPMSYQVFLEWFHRLIAGSVSVGTLAVSFLVFTNTSLRQLVGRWCVIALGLLAAQVALGGMTVLGLLHPGWVSSHLAVGLAFFGALIMVRLKLVELSGRGRTEPLLAVCFRRLSKESIFSNFAMIVLFALYLQCLLGGGVSSNYAGLACPDFPKCLGSWRPAFEGLVRFQIVHRLGAAVVAALTVFFLIGVVVKRRELPATVLGWSSLAAVLLALQVFLGIGNVVWGLPVLMSVAHLAVAALLVGSFVVIAYELRRA